MATQTHDQSSNSEAHQHHYQHEISHSDRNQAHWDKAAKTYNSEHTQKEFGDLINKMTEFVLSNISAIGVDFIDPSSTFEKPDTNKSQRQVRVLDYACGPGTITNILAGRATQYIGLDVSPNMIEEYNNRFSAETEGEKLDAQAFVANLIGAEADPPKFLEDAKYFDFDLVVVGLGFHHFDNLPLVTARLVERVKPGGVLMIIDFFTHDKEDMGKHDAIHTVAHHGFSGMQIETLFRATGLKDVKLIEYPHEILLRGKAVRRLFMATGKKPA